MEIVINGRRVLPWQRMITFDWTACMAGMLHTAEAITVLKPDGSEISLAKGQTIEIQGGEIFKVS